MKAGNGEVGAVDSSCFGMEGVCGEAGLASCCWYVSGFSTLLFWCFWVVRIPMGPLETAAVQTGTSLFPLNWERQPLPRSLLVGRERVADFVYNVQKQTAK